MRLLESWFGLPPEEQAARHQSWTPILLGKILPVAASLLLLPAVSLLAQASASSGQPSTPKTQLLRAGDTDPDPSSITIYLPPPGSAVGTGIVVCPGGGYAHLSLVNEGSKVAEWLNSLGVAAFVLKYRLGPKFHHPSQLEDARQAIRMVRQQAADFGILPNRIGIMGFSAGGHLAATASTHFDAATHPDTRPDFAILCYPVIAFGQPYTHKGSQEMLLGKDADPKLLEELSADKHVTADTPPTFLFHTNADTGVPAENSLVYYEALRKAGVPAEIHVYERGPHGVGLAQQDPVLGSWPARLADWLRIHGWLARP
jgi:acetyl esterase/lipase